MKNIILLTSCFLLLTCVFAGCSGLKEAREIKNAPMPPRYIETKQKEAYSSEDSLWSNNISLYEDLKAKRVNDLVTILITEQTTASKKATTNASKNSSASYNITNLPSGVKINNLPLLGDLTKGISGNDTSALKGSGDTSRQGSLTATITAKVVEVLPNSNLVIESRKEVLVNNEKEIIVLRGMVRPEDIAPNNTVLSQHVADAQISLVGDGVLDDKQSQGWLVRFLDKVWPF